MNKNKPVGAEGFEPSLTDPNSVVLPLHQTPMVYVKISPIFANQRELPNQNLKNENICNMQAEEEGFEPPCPLGQPR